jgi:hypothetical protein
MHFQQIRKLSNDRSRAAALASLGVRDAARSKLSEKRTTPRPGSCPTVGPVFRRDAAHERRLPYRTYCNRQRLCRQNGRQPPNGDPLSSPRIPSGSYPVLPQVLAALRRIDAAGAVGLRRLGRCQTGQLPVWDMVGPTRWLDRCAQFCAHHQTLPSVTECRGTAGKPCWTGHLSHSVSIRSSPCKSLIPRATITWAQGVRGSNPRAPTTICSSLRGGFL